MTSPDLDLEALREVVEAAVPKRGRLYSSPNHKDYPDEWEVWCEFTVGDESHDVLWFTTDIPEVAALIVAAVNALPVLLDLAELTDKAISAREEATSERDAALAEVESWKRTAADQTRLERDRAEKAEAEVADLREKVNYWVDERDLEIEKGDDARAEVARLTAVVQGVMERAEADRDQTLLSILSGGTDTPKGEGE